MAAELDGNQQLVIDVYNDRADLTNMRTLLLANKSTGDINYVVRVNLGLLANTPLLDAAHSFVHEMKHIENMRNLVTTLQERNLKPDEIVMFDASRRSSQLECINEESSAESVELESYIYEKALIPNHNIAIQQENANTYILSGRSVSSRQWRQLLVTAGGFCR